MRKITSEKEKKSLARTLLYGLEGAVWDFGASVKSYIDSGDLSQAGEILAFGEEIRKAVTTIEVLLGLRLAEVEMAPEGGLLVKPLKAETAQQ